METGRYISTLSDLFNLMTILTRLDIYSQNATWLFITWAEVCSNWRRRTISVSIKRGVCLARSSASIGNPPLLTPCQTGTSRLTQWDRKIWLLPKARIWITWRPLLDGNSTFDILRTGGSHLQRKKGSIEIRRWRFPGCLRNGLYPLLSKIYCNRNLWPLTHLGWL